MKTELKFKVNALRTLPSPYRKKEEDNALETIYYLLVNMRDLPENIPMDVNPRVPKMGTNVAKKLVRAVTEPETDFYINNRGIVISAKSLSFNSIESEVTIDIGDQDDENDKYNYGILDGGHTYTAIMQNRKKLSDDIQKYVRLEIITNVNNITRLSDARNTSVQVSDIALFNLEDSFEDVKQSIKNEKYSKKIAYKDNDTKPINVSELLRLLFAFDIDKYPDDTLAPIQSYTGKAQVFKRYKDAYKTDFYKSLTKELPILVKLYDTIEADLPSKYSDYKKKNGYSHPNFGNVKGVEVSASGNKTNYLELKVNYNISAGYIYPIFGAFRALLQYDEETKSVSWMFDPIEIWNEIGFSLTQNIFDSSKDPVLAGKDKQLWLSNYRIVETQSLRKLLKRKN